MSLETAPPSKQLAYLVREQRKAQGWSQAELAARARTTQAAIARIELGAANPTLRTLDLIAAALNKDLLIQMRPALGQRLTGVAGPKRKPIN